MEKTTLSAPGKPTDTSNGDFDDATARAQDWYHWSIMDIVDHFHTDKHTGLTVQQVADRREVFGFNTLPDSQRRSSAAIILEQLQGPMVLLLVVVAIVSIGLQEYVDSVAVLAIIVLNSALGFFQDYRAEQALAALRQLAVPTVKVRRQGATVEVATRELVPGDVLLIEAGNLVGADCRLIDSANLQVMEAALTGESEPALKHHDKLDNRTLGIADRQNMVFQGTTVSSGRGVGIVTETGLQTEFGRIAVSLEAMRDASTPLQKRLSQMGVTLALIAIGIVVLVFFAGLLAGESVRLMLLTSLSLAVAIVPEGLPAVATVALALGARRMATRNALIRRLPAVETLGSVTVICSDKTGTLTQNKMTVSLLDVAGKSHVVERPSCENRAAVTAVQSHSGLSLLLTLGTLCNDCSIATSPGDQAGCLGDPTELAIALAAEQYGFHKDELESIFPRIGELSFDSFRKRMTTLHRIDSQSSHDRQWLASLNRVLPGDCDDVIVCTKGALDAVVERCTFIWEGDQPAPVDDHRLKRIQKVQTDLAHQGMRVLGVAFKVADKFEEGDIESIENELIFIGMVAMIDPPRREASQAVHRCRDAGIRPVMITGDHALSALSIARQIGITDHSEVVEGGLVSSGFDAGNFNTPVYARVSPLEKLEIVERLQKYGEVVAMTGDGVNDAPALKKADIGIAMGITGTDVAKEAADMVLLDDNFATIVNAVEEGRIVFDNIRKFVKYTMTSNAGELFVMIIGPLLGMPIPLLPLQILWINLVTDGLPGLALSVEKAEKNVMQRPPYPPGKRIFDQAMVRDILWIGLLMAGTSLVIGYFSWASAAHSHEYWRTIIFTTLTIAQLGNALATRSTSSTIFESGVFTNKLLVFAVVLTFVLQLSVIYFEPLQTIFHTASLSATDFGLSVMMGCIVFIAVEVKKLWARKRQVISLH